VQLGVPEMHGTNPLEVNDTHVGEHAQEGFELTKNKLSNLYLINKYSSVGVLIEERIVNFKANY